MEGGRWKVGRVEGWKRGSRKSGKLEDWKGGRGTSAFSPARCGWEKSVDERRAIPFVGYSFGRLAGWKILIWEDGYG